MYAHFFMVLNTMEYTKDYEKRSTKDKRIT